MAKIKNDNVDNHGDGMDGENAELPADEDGHDSNESDGLDQMLRDGETTYSDERQYEKFKSMISDTCPVCKTPWYKGGDNDDDADDDSGGLDLKKRKVPVKVAWCFPIIPRIERMYANKKHAKMMRWHHEELYAGNNEHVAELAPTVGTSKRNHSERMPPKVVKEKVTRRKESEARAVMAAEEGAEPSAPIAEDGGAPSASAPAPSLPPSAPGPSTQVPNAADMAKAAAVARALQTKAEILSTSQLLVPQAAPSQSAAAPTALSAVQAQVNPDPETQTEADMEAMRQNMT
uniref:Transposon protein, putative, CACTA, En/Spm sub-class n=2 Tax=Oryza sativa subsp. japonica TaxID=39947 RepID=Q53PV8_ORYSJ|nr:hypothetical protein [Oryza sativa Japonica Group]ABA92632.1 transposon protein, putative, CACTA, En/Spm sub-class [Oryza sativa Japonica Group]